MGNTFSYTLRCIVVGIALLVSACLNVYAQKAGASVSDTIAKKVERIDSISKVAIATEQVAYTDSAWKADSLKMMTEEIKTPKQIVAATDTTKHRRDWATGITTGATTTGRCLSSPCRYIGRNLLSPSDSQLSATSASFCACHERWFQ